MALNFAPFVTSQGIRDAYRNRPALKLGARGSTVRLLQGALLDYGLDLPVSTGQYGRPDGIFGEETQSAVLAFQAGNGLPADGIAGTKTIQALDDFLSAIVQKQSVVPVPKRSAPASEYYTLGKGDPFIKIDKGAGVWNSKPKMAAFEVLQQQPQDNVLPVARVFLGLDAANHLDHYLDGSGAAYRVNLEAMLASVPSALVRLEQEAEQARVFVESLDVGTYDITSTKSQGGANKKEESLNWYYAINWYDSWGKGRATVSEGMFGREFALDFEYHVYDRYNWDYGKGVTIATVAITDEFMGEFHRQGLAREFDCVGVVRRRLTWRKLQPLSRQQLTTPLGGFQK